MSIYASLLVGAVVGLFITGIQLWQQRSDESTNAAAQAAATRTRLFTLVSDEMQFDLSAVNAMIAAQGDNLLELMFRVPLKSEFWASISASGDTKAIADLDLLSAIASAYQQVRAVADWQRRGADGWSGGAISINVDGKPLLEVIQQFSRTVFPAAKAALEKAIAAVALAVPKMTP